MKPLDQHRIFQLFTDTVATPEEDTIISDINSHPYILLGMVIRGVENFYILSDMMRLKHGSSYERIKTTVQKTYFERLYSYVEQFNEQDQDSILEGLSHDYSSINYALDHMIFHFENLEEYEKCNKLLKIKQAFSL